MKKTKIQPLLMFGRGVVFQRTNVAESADYGFYAVSRCFVSASFPFVEIYQGESVVVKK